MTDSNRAVVGGVWALQAASTRWLALLSVFALAISGCQTIDDGPPAYTNTWSPAPLAKADDTKARTPKTAGSPATAGTPLLANTPRGKTTFLEGTGRFVGDPQSARRQAASDGNDGVTLN